MSESASKFLGGIIGDIKSGAAYPQLFLGFASGWATSFAYATDRIGKLSALAIGCSIIVLEIAYQEGYIKVDWSKVEDTVTGREQNLAVGKKWYSNLIGDEKGPKVNVLHIFLTGFAGGVATGILTA